MVLWAWFLQDFHTNENKDRETDRATGTYSTRATFGAKLKEGLRPLPLAALPQIPCQGKGWGRSWGPTTESTTEWSSAGSTTRVHERKTLVQKRLATEQDYPTELSAFI